MDAAITPSPKLTRGEAVLISIIATIAAVELAAYVPYRIGWRVVPIAVLIGALTAGVCVFTLSFRRAAGDARADAALAAVVVGCFGWMLGMARPELLPMGGGPDLTHHLVLINYIERHWQLVYDPALVPYLGDMLVYTPGSHLLIALAGDWARSGGLHAAHTVLAATVALKAGVVFCIAHRLLPRARTPFAVTAVLLLFVPYRYFVGSFAVDSFWAQVVCELFACAMWWALDVWDDQPSWRAASMFGIFGAAAFVTWPIWTGPLALAMAAVVAVRNGLTTRQKARHLAIGLGPIALFGALHSVGRLHWLFLAGVSGAVVWPSLAVGGRPFALLAAIGVLLVASRRTGRVTTALLAAIALQATVLFVIAIARGASTPYMALKMGFLAVYPLSVAAALALAAAWAAIVRRAAADRWAWIAAGAAALLVARHVARQPTPRPVITESAYLAGAWTRAHLPPACVDYVVADGYTGYWLHLAVLDNPRNTVRVEDPDTFEPSKAFERWIYPDGLPYAIVDDVNGFSKALFNGTDEIARFGRSVVIQRRGKSTCAQ